MIKAFLDEHGNGFWLHGLGAVAIMLLFWYKGWPLWLGFSTSNIIWIVRECIQHPPFDIFTFHRILEWGTPLVAALLMWVLLS